MKRKIALITGATSGIGASFAEKLASQNYDLIITGRRKDKITNFACELTTKYNVNVEVLLIELTKKEDLDLLLQKVDATKNLEILINNAGYGTRCKFVEEKPEIYEEMFILHDYAAIKLMQIALKNMLNNNNGKIINVSSVGAFLIMPTKSAYNPAKAYLISLSEIIAEEIKDSNVCIQVLCPGMTRSDVWARVGEDINDVAARLKWPHKLMPAEFVVDKSLSSLGKNKVICIPGFNNKFLALFAILKKCFSMLFG
ncbi:MAG: SDR family NAD(P)-dependent oxidoreductase [Gammaproteobacteria bacterium]|nr:SDR family NAD(P)-dependent oxidoreductase [Gammaproteobacteria bacterium]